MRISWVYLNATGISPNSRTSLFGIRVLLTVVVLASINVFIVSPLEFVALSADL
jgi:hypothetical protein